MHFFQSFYLQKKVYFIAGAASVVFVLSFFWPVLFDLAVLLLVLLGFAVLIDGLLLYFRKNGIQGSRSVPVRLSNGDENRVDLEFSNRYHFKAALEITDEIPFQFQERNWKRFLVLESEASATLSYFLKPLTRGEYVFGKTNVFVSGPLKLAQRKYSLGSDETVKVYPSFQQMRRYQLLASTNQLQQAGVKVVRRLGHSMEFEHIREYVRGDDYRTLNWKATARHDQFMVNNYTDERSQQVYCIINKGRIMRMPFNGMTLLDYSINAALVLANVSLVKQDKAGLITFAEQIDSFIPADKKPTQMNLLLEHLYRQETRFLEPDFEKLFSVIRNRITQRSLLVLFTNFESMESLERELPSLKRIAHYHLLMVVMFENSELRHLMEMKAVNTEEIYIKTIADKFAHEKKLMVQELRRNGIVSLLTEPEKLTVNTINKYIELKNRQSI